MSGQKIHLFRAGRSFILRFSFLTSLAISPLFGEIRAGFQASGWPQEGFGGPGWIRYESENEHGAAQPVDVTGTVEFTEKRSSASASLSSAYVQIYAGRRDLPVPTMFFSDSEFPPGFLPPRRRDDLLFARIFPLWFTPGIFGARNLAGAGIYFQYKQNLLLAYHPLRRIWGTTMRLSGTNSKLHADLEGEKKDYQGYFTSGVMEKDGITITMEGERRPYWDRFRYREEIYGRLTSSDSSFLMRDETDRSLGVQDRSVKRDRRYRSAFLSGRAISGPIELLASGMDRGDVAFRRIVLGRPVPDESGWYALAESGYMQMQIYRENRLHREVRLGIGAVRRSRHSLYESLLITGQAPSISLEMRGLFRLDSSITLQSSLILSGSKRKDTFEYMDSVEHGEGQGRFLERCRFAFRLRLASAHVRAVVFYSGRTSEQRSIREWGYLRLEYQKQF